MKSLKGAKGILLAMISSGTFGLIPLFTIPLVRNMGMSEPGVLFYRFFLSALMMAVICLFRRDSLKIPIKYILPILGLGLLYALTALFLVYSYNYISSGVATTIHFLYPLCVSFLMIAFFKEQKSKVLLISALLSLIGVALMCWTSSASFSLWGIMLAALTIVTYGAYIVGLNQSAVGKLPADVLTFYVILACTAIFYVYAVLADGGVGTIPSSNALFYLVGLAFLATVISDFALILAVKYAGSTVTAILGSMEPLVAVAVGVMAFSEYFSLQTFFGLVLILTSVVLVILGDQRKKKLQPEEIRIKK